MPRIGKVADFDVIDEATVQKAQPATGSMKSYKEKIKEEVKKRRSHA